MATVTMTVNGKQVRGEVESRTLLVEFLRYQLLAESVLAIARRPWLRRRVLGLLQRAPGLFRWTLAQLLRPRPPAYARDSAGT